MFSSETLEVCRNVATGEFAKRVCCESAKTGNPYVMIGAGLIAGAVAIGLSVQSVKEAEKNDGT